MLRPALLVFTLLAAGFALAQNSPDHHYSASRTQDITRKSVFVHGYLHGYEEGFHLADMDIQLGRGSRVIDKCHEARKAEGYRREFGDKQFFQRGFREGLRVGYADGMAGRAFRAFQQIDSIAVTSPEAGSDPVFDRGFSLGYAAGQRQGLLDGRRDSTYTPPLPACPYASAQHDRAQNFCGAYVGGYRVGYSDGFVNVARPAAAQMEARVGK